MKGTMHVQSMHQTTHVQTMHQTCIKLCMFNSKKRHLNGNYEREQTLVLVIRQGLDIAQQTEEHPLHLDAIKGSFSNSLLKFQQPSTWEKPRKSYTACLPPATYFFSFFSFSPSLVGSTHFAWCTVFLTLQSLPSQISSSLLKNLHLLCVETKNFFQ